MYVATTREEWIKLMFDYMLVIWLLNQEYDTTKTKITNDIAEIITISFKIFLARQHS